MTYHLVYKMMLPASGFSFLFGCATFLLLTCFCNVFCFCCGVLWQINKFIALFLLFYCFEMCTFWFLQFWRWQMFVEFQCFIKAKQRRWNEARTWQSEPFDLIRIVLASFLETIVGYLNNCTCTSTICLFQYCLNFIHKHKHK